MYIKYYNPLLRIFSDNTVEETEDTDFQNTYILLSLHIHILLSLRPEIQR